MVVSLENVLDDRYIHSLDDAKAVGIDIGSRGSKAVLIYRGMLYTEIVPSGVSSKKTAVQLLESLLRESGAAREELDGIVGTGYGSIAMEFPGIPFHPVTEITCHALGAHYMHTDTRTVIDIGGQDSKTIKVNHNDGKVIDFIMNDKCAAGTGRFLEKVAQILDLSLDEMGEAVLKSENPSEISSQCVVFAESEVISLRATGSLKEDIAYGIHLATARRVQSLLKRTGFEKDILFTGGVSNNKGMKRALEEVIGEKLADTKFDTTYAGALGAAITAYQMKEKSAAE